MALKGPVQRLGNVDQQPAQQDHLQQGGSKCQGGVAQAAGRGGQPRNCTCRPVGGMGGGPQLARLATGTSMHTVLWNPRALAKGMVPAEPPVRNYATRAAHLGASRPHEPSPPPPARLLSTAPCSPACRRLPAPPPRTPPTPPAAGPTCRGRAGRRSCRTAPLRRTWVAARWGWLGWGREGWGMGAAVEGHARRKEEQEGGKSG